MELFGGIGGDANWFLNRNIRNTVVNKYITNVCSGMLKVGNRLLPVNLKSGEHKYYSNKNVSCAHENDGEYFVNKLGDNPIIYNSKDKFICIKSGGDVFDYVFSDVDNAKELKLSNSEINWINSKVEFADYLNIPHEDVNDVLINGMSADDTPNDVYLDDSVKMFSPFLFAGSYVNLNDEYCRVNGSFMQNPWFCKMGIICEINCDFILNGLAYMMPILNGVSVSYCSNKVGKYNKFTNSLANLTVFIKFEKIWFLVSFDLVEIFRQFVNFVRELSNNFNQKTTTQDVSIMSKEYWKQVLSSLHNYVKAIFLILRSFSIGYEIINECMSVLNKVSLDLSSCSLGVSAYATYNHCGF
jgi:hypothetical protein